MATKKKRRSPKKKTQKKINFSLSWSGLISCGLLTLVALVWAFILGVLVGRGYHPESVIPQVARLLPGQSEPAPVPEQEVTESQVLKPEELGFFESLQDGSSSQSRTEQPRTSSQQQGRRRSNQAQAAGSTSKEADFRYLYQVAAFKSKDQARALNTRLKAAGLASSVTSVRRDAGLWYRVQVTFQGTPSDILGLKARLKELGCPKPFLRSKTPL